MDIGTPENQNESDLAVVVKNHSIGLGVKRFVDLITAILALLFCLPLLIVISIIIRLDSPGSIFYNQERIGLNGKPFMLFKFRTMYQNRSGVIPGKEVRPGDDRVTRIGKWLRRFKVDELPQLLNVILGQMAIIGPRPDIPVQVAAYTPYQRQRLMMLPGLSGMAQVSGNIWLSWPDRIKLDIWYIQNWSLWLDIKIIWYTFVVILATEQPEHDPFDLKKIL